MLNLWDKTAMIHLLHAVGRSMLLHKIFRASSGAREVTSWDGVTERLCGRTPSLRQHRFPKPACSAGLKKATM